MNGPPAGWYPDPDPAGHGGRQRYWDGAAWTSATNPPELPAAPPPASALDAAAAERAHATFRRRRNGAIVACIVVAVALVAIRAGIEGSERRRAEPKIDIKDVGPLLESTTTSPPVPIDLPSALLPSLDGYRVVPPASGTEELTIAAQVADAAEAGNQAAVQRGLDVSGYIDGYIRRFLATADANGVNIGLFQTRTSAGAAHYCELEVHYWTEQRHATVAAGSDHGLPGGTLLEVATPDADGNRWEVVIGAKHAVCINVASYTSASSPTPLVAFAVAAAQAARIG